MKKEKTCERQIPREILGYKGITAKDKIFLSIIASYIGDKKFSYVSDEKLMKNLSPHENLRGIKKELKRLKDKNLIYLNDSKRRRVVYLNKEKFPDVDFSVGVSISEELMNNNLSYTDKLILAVYEMPKYNQRSKSVFIGMTLDGFKTALKRAKSKLTNVHNFKNKIDQNEPFNFQNEPFLISKMNPTLNKDLLNKNNNKDLLFTNVNNIMKISFSCLDQIVFLLGSRDKSNLLEIQKSLESEISQMNEMLKKINPVKENISNLENQIKQNPCIVDELYVAPRLENRSPASKTLDGCKTRLKDNAPVNSNIIYLRPEKISNAKSNVNIKNPKGKDMKDSKKYSKLAYEIFNHINDRKLGFPKHRENTKRYDLAMSLIDAMLKGRLYSIINIGDAVLQMKEEKKRGNVNVANGSIVDDALRRKYRKSEIEFILEELSKVFQAGYAPENKKNVIGKSIYELSTNNYSSHSWLLPILFKGEAIKNKKRERKFKPLDRSTREALRNACIVTTPELQPELETQYSLIFDEVYEYWKNEKEKFYDMKMYKQYIEGYESFETSLIEYVAKYAGFNIANITPFWFRPTSKVFLNFLNSIVNKEEALMWEQAYQREIAQAERMNDKDFMKVIKKRYGRV
jgi:hypothetical protein